MAGKSGAASPWCRATGVTPRSTLHPCPMCRTSSHGVCRDEDAAGRPRSVYPRTVLADAPNGAHSRSMSRVDSASRVIRAEPDRVFAALVDANALATWLPPHGMTGRFERFDARRGGSYRLVLTYAEASSGQGKTTSESDVVEARFTEILPNERIRQEVDFVATALTARAPGRRRLRA